MTSRAPSRRSEWLLVLGFTAAWYGLAQLAAALWLGQPPQAGTVPFDLTAHLGLAVLLFPLARSAGAFVAAFAAVLALFHTAKALKIAILGGPLAPDDVHAVRSLFLVLHGRELVLAAGAAAATLGLVALALRPRMRRAWPALLGISGIVAALALAPGGVVTAMDRWLGNTPWDQRANFQARGLVLHLVQEGARHLTRAVRSPDPLAVGEALMLLDPADRMPVAGTAGGGTPGRNLHVIVLESFWDAAALGHAGLSADPLDPRLRRLWQSAGHSRALSPVFGGYTANAELEALCGFPVIEDAVFFEGRLRREAPCLPRHLGAAGYTTVASHPNVAVFWNRVHAYRRAGFASYWSVQDFALDDMNREMLSDSSLYRQVLSRIRPLIEAGTPVFSYILTFSGHLDYPLGPARPAVIEVDSREPLVRDYANNLHYKSRELMDYLDVLAQVDPDGLVVVFGDHLPFLGYDYAAYVESGLLAGERAAFTDAMFRTLVATPLLVLDGRRGPVPTGDVPLYRLPALILDLLGDERPSVLRLAADPGRPAIRPLPGVNLLVGGDAVLACRAGAAADPACAQAADWVMAVETVATDLFSGRQHVLHGLPGPPDTGRDPL